MNTVPKLADSRDLSHAFVSVIIPTYQSASVLPDAIESVLNQTQPADEVIIVDDGSDDDTEAACHIFGDSIRLLRQANAGASVARNTGIASARRTSSPSSVEKGDITETDHWLAFLDADDTWDRQKLELQFAALSQNPEADFALSSVLAWSPHEQTYTEYRYVGPLDPDRMRAELLVRNIFSGLCSSILVRRDAIESVGCFAAGHGSEDRRLAIELLAEHRAVLVDLPLVRQRPGPAHWTDPQRQRREMLHLISDYEDLYKRLDPTGRLKRRARARVHERTGMHYLENGELKAAANDLARAVFLRPWTPNPWRVLANACLGRLKLNKHVSPAKTTVATPTV
ncbi:MAG: glycosyltransferase family 2 protein [Phycisphaerae bacterium]